MSLLSTFPTVIDARLVPGGPPTRVPTAVPGGTHERHARGHHAPDSIIARRYSLHPSMLALIIAGFT